MRVFIAGPIRGRPGNNFAAFDAAADAWRAAGCEVVNPCDHARRLGIGPNDPETPAVRQQLLSEALIELACCDAIALLPGWTESEGARGEVREALRMRKRFLCAEVVELIGDYSLREPS